jgi:acetate kinase
VLNSGSSSLKAGVFVRDQHARIAGERAVVSAEASGIGKPGGRLSMHDADGKELSSALPKLDSQDDALAAITDGLRRLDSSFQPIGIGHRIVHGGPSLREHSCLTETVLAALKASVHYAPLHLPGSLRLIEQSQKLYPGVEQVVCFDTAFHQTMPEVAKRLPVPERFVREGVRRYGFHGLSYESLLAQLRAEQKPLPERIVLAHLGSGSSLCAVHHGESVDTTMGMTPCGGVPMSTRTGDLDPGVLLFLARGHGLSIDALEQLVNHEAGLAAIAENSGDMQEIIQTMQPKTGQSAADQNAERASRRSQQAALAFDIYTTSVAKTIASLTVSLRGLDLLVFAGGIGEHSSEVRSAILEKLGPFGIAYSTEANQHHAGTISGEHSKVPVRILSAEEDLVIAGHTRRILADTACASLS